MNKNYTQYNSDSIYQFLDENDTTEAIDFLKDPSNFRSFNQGLSEIMIKKGYIPEDATARDTAQTLSKKLTAIGSTITLNTINSWFIGEHRPKIESGYRKQIYEICFALNLTLTETIWFFHHVYYDRAFNCHTIDESVFFFCIKNNLSYKEAQNIIKKINNSPTTHSSSNISSNYTIFVQENIKDIETTDALIAFLSQNKENFASWNASAYQSLNALFQLLIPSDVGKRDIDNLLRKLKKMLNNPPQNPQERKNIILEHLHTDTAQNDWHLIMQEFFTENTDYNDAINNLKNVNICSNTFVLNWILYMRTKAQNEDLKFEKKQLKNLPYIVKNNFPSKKIMSDILSEEKISFSKSYDSIRKMMILLYFYRFWINVKLNDSDVDVFSLNDVFIDEMNYSLYKCGYEPLFEGNPYDWLFLTSAQADEPLLYFRNCMAELLFNDDEF